MGDTINLIPEVETDEMYEHYKFVVDRGQNSMRIDKYLVNYIENSTRNKVQQTIKADNVLVNNSPVKSNYKVKPNDIISVVLAHPPRETNIIPQNIPLNIVYEDEDLLVVNKEAGMVVHPGFGNFEGTLINALAYHFNQLPYFQNDLDKRPGLVHRIDKDTSGLLVIAKNEFAMNFLAKQFFNKTTQRVYHALVWGNFEEDEGTITGHIGRDIKDRMQMSVFPDGTHGKHAVTHYKVLERFRYVTLIECTLETGRTHQIRAHMKYIGHILFNDARYGGNQVLKGTTFSKYKQFVENCFQIIPRQALHAKTLGFIHPTTKKEMFFEVDLPEDMQKVLEKWRTYINYSSLSE
ncbi:RluA family pseudouridine synthase [Apibacter adventoris]|uniref:RluA family pseudouridine synthase n=1 Tax=Apibacter adventoris TaxID=1679466 RepID=UPI000CF69E45|nr:RluA family pseudouridine synthase [Apibacter adventoris]PQL94009.1 RNA pseudouridine synthase [Apibacter adventoris]